MRAMRWVVVFAVLFYAGWMAATLLDYATGAIALPQMDHLPAPSNLSPDLSNPVVVVLWLATIALFVASAVFVAGHNRICAVFYVAALAANMSLFLLERPAMGDPLFLPLITGLGLIGLVIVASSGRSGAWAPNA